MLLRLLCGWNEGMLLILLLLFVCHKGILLLLMYRWCEGMILLLPLKIWFGSHFVKLREKHFLAKLFFLLNLLLKKSDF